MKYTIKSQTRTIYVNLEEVYKFKLTFPELTVFNNEFVFFNEIIYFPFFNINERGNICFGYNDKDEIIKPKNKNDFEKIFWNSNFSFSNISGFISFFGSGFEYETKTKKNFTSNILLKRVKEYCKYWEKHGFESAYETFKGKFYD